MASIPYVTISIPLSYVSCANVFSNILSGNTIFVRSSVDKSSGRFMAGQNKSNTRSAPALIPCKRAALSNSN